MSLKPRFKIKTSFDDYRTSCRTGYIFEIYFGSNGITSTVENSNVRDYTENRLFSSLVFVYIYD